MSKSNVNEMDNSMPALIPTSSQGEPGDIDIFVFSNGETQTPPRKYHLTVQDLDVWDSTLNFLARAHYGRQQFPVTLYTTNGQKIETPLVLANNSTYVAVANKDTFIPGGYDQYLMKASKSWIKRYGSVPSSTSNEGKIISAGKTINNGRPEDVTEQLVMNKIEENTAEVVVTATANGDVNNINENPTMLNLPINNDAQKQEDKQKTTTRSSTPVLRKNINNKNHINSKNKPPTQSPLKKRPGSPPTKKSVIKAISAPGKPKYTTSQMANKNNAVPGSNIGPELITSAKATSKAKTSISSKPIDNGIKKLEQDIDQFTEDEKSLKQFFPLYHDSISKREVSTKEYADKEYDEKKVFDTLQTTRANIDGYKEPTETKLLNDINSALPKSFSTEMQRGEVINLRLRIEVTQGEKKDNKSAPLMDIELCNLIAKEKSSQVNIDEVVFQKEALSGILEEFQINKPDQKYLILPCDCCNNYYRQAVKMTEEPNTNQSDTIKSVRNNKDYIVLLPYAFTNRDDDVLGCKCVEAVPKLDKTVQTSMIFETNEYPKVAPHLRTDDLSTETPMIPMDSVSHSYDCLCDRACEMPELPSENKVSPTPPPSNKIRNIIAQYYNNSSSPRTPDMMNIGNTKVSCCPSPPKENSNPSNCLVYTKPRERMLDKSTQTDSFCFLMEVRRQSDGRYSFHLPPLHMVKLYN